MENALKIFKLKTKIKFIILTNKRHKNEFTV